MADPSDNIIKLAEMNQAGHSEDGLALAFATAHAGDQRFVALWGQWLAYDGTGYG
jgi:hypothetical protein